MSQKIATAILELKTDTGQIKSGLADVVSQSRGASQAIAAVGKMLAAAFTVTAIVSAGKQFIDFAGNVTDLSQRLKINTDTVQKWQLAFEQAGIPVEAVAKASERLSIKLVGGDKSAVAALDKMGLSVEKLKAMKPEDRFTVVADAVGRLQDQGEKLYASKTLFGKGGPELLAGLDGHLAETLDKIEEMGLVIDEQTIKAADDFGDQLGLLGKQLMGIVGVIVGPLLPALSALGNALMQVGKFVGDVLGFAIKGTLTAIYSLGAAIDTFLATILEAAQRIPLLGKHLGFVSGAAKFFREDAKRAGEDLEKLWKVTDKVGASADTTKPKLLGLGGAADDSGKKAKKAAEEWKRLSERIDEINRANAAPIFKRPEYNPGEGELPGLGTLRAYVAAIEEMRKSPGQLMPIDPHSIELAIANAGALGIEQIGEQLPPVIRKNATSGFAQAIAAFPRLLQDALTGGGGLGGAIQAMGSLIGSSLGSRLLGDGGGLNGIGNKLAGIFGDSFGLALPGIGAALGSLVGPALAKLWDGLKRAFGGPSQKEFAGRDLEARFEQQFASFGDMVNRIGDAYAATGRTREQAQRDIKAMLDAERQGPEAVQRWINSLQGALDQQTALEDGFSALEQAIAAAGGAMPDALQPMIDQLLAMGNLTDEQRERLRRLAQDAAPDFKALEQEAAGLGISIEALGPAFQQAHVTEEGVKLATFFERARKAGGDVGGMIAGMKDEVQGLVNEALRYGAKLPEQLRPVVENLFNTGNLVDENGNKLEDLSRLSFENTPLEQSTAAIVDAIHELRDLFASLPGVAQSAASGITNALNGIPTSRDFTLNIGTNGSLPPDTGDWRTSEGPIYAAAGVYGTVKSATGFVGGEAGREDVVFGGAGRNLAQDVATELARILPAGSGEQTLNIQVDTFLDGHKMAESFISRVVKDKRGVGTVLTGYLAGNLGVAPA